MFGRPSFMWSFPLSVYRVDTHARFTCRRCPTIRVGHERPSSAQKKNPQVRPGGNNASRGTEGRTSSPRRRRGLRGVGVIGTKRALLVGGGAPSVQFDAL